MRVLPIPTIRKRRCASTRKYSVVSLKFCGARPFAAGAVHNSKLTHRPLRVVPKVDARVFTSKGASSKHCILDSHLFVATRPLTPQEAISHGPLLPPQTQEAKGKLTLVLDLDETLIHAALPQLEEVSSAAHDFSFLIDHPQSNALSDLAREVVVWQRPGLAEFLLQASRLAEIVVFTASLKGIIWLLTTQLNVF